jgi:predicted helicase
MPPGEPSLRQAARAVDDRWEASFTKCLYRPFDLRAYYHNDDLVDRARQEVMANMLIGGNLGLIATRQTRDQWDTLVTRYPCDHKSCAAYDTNSLFPLYLYPNGKQTAFDTGEAGGKGGRRANLNPAFIKDVSAHLGLRFIPDDNGDLVETFGPEDVFNYMYAVFHSPTYRKRYAEFLKMDFPRLPLTSDVELFRKLCALGARLVTLHLMEADGSGPKPSYPVPGDNRVEGVHYTTPGEGAERGRVWINKTQYFEGVPPEVWEFHIGGYQVADKWLKDRKGRGLSYDDREHYKRIIAALDETRQLMKAIDEAIPGWPWE